MRICAPTLECREEDPDTFDVLYNKLESVIKNVKSRDSLVIAGDFKAKIGTSALESTIYRKQIGMYGKERTNSNGCSLLELWQNNSHLNLQLLFSNTNNSMNQNENCQSKLVKFKTLRVSP